MGIKCPSCEYQNNSPIIDFNITNVNGDHEHLYLLQCDSCKKFTVVSWVDRWYAGDTWFYGHPEYTAEQAETIFLFFVGCRGTKRCGCDIHRAVGEWIFPAKISIFERLDIIQRFKEHPEYSEWIVDWRGVIN